MTQPVEARIITALRPESSMPIRAGLLTLKMTSSFIRAHGTWLANAATLAAKAATNTIPVVFSIGALTLLVPQHPQPDEAFDVWPQREPSLRRTLCGCRARTAVCVCKTGGSTFH